MINKLVVLIAVILMSSSVVSGESKIDPPVTTSSVSIVSLLSNPSFWDGKKVGVVGVLSWGFENQYIYLDCESFKLSNIRNAILIDAPISDQGSFKGIQEVAEHSAGSYVLLSGEFLATPKLDHPGASMITKVFRIQSWHEIINAEREDVICH